MSIRRPLPQVTPWNSHYWSSGADGVLRMQRCRSCERIQHPPVPRCALCHSDQLEIVALSGRATVEAFTINHQQWHPAFEPPYVVAVVSLEEDRAVRITTNIVGCSPDDVHIGMPVQVTFEQHDDVWLPVFVPDPARATRQPPLGGRDVPSHDLERAPRRFATPSSAEKFERNVVLSGIGMSQVGRRLGRDPLGLMVDAALAAIADAGLDVADVDGISSYPGVSLGGLSGSTGGGIMSLEEALRIRPTWFGSGLETSGQTGAVINAMLAVNAGLARHVVCVRGVWESTYQAMERAGEVRTGGGSRVSGEMEWRLPYGAFSAANWIGMMANRHMQTFGTTREQLGAIALNARRNAMRNPYAVYREPLSLDDYLGARTITTPFGLYDCDVPCDGAIAVVVSHVDTVPDLAGPIVGVEAVGTAIGERISWDQGTLLHEPVLEGAARHIWTRTGPHAGRHRRHRALRRLHVQLPVLARDARLLRDRRRRTVRRGRSPHRARGRAAAQHPRRPAERGPAARLELPARSLCAAARRGRRAPGAEQARGGALHRWRRPSGRRDDPHPPPLSRRRSGGFSSLPVAMRNRQNVSRRSRVSRCGPRPSGTPGPWC
jgi:uncharacterized OB-fold protein